MSEEKNEAGSQPVEITWLRRKLELREVYEMGLEFSFVSQDWRQCHPWVHCKDYLQDAVSSTHHNKAIECYGFEYDPKKWPPVYLGRTRVAVANGSDKEFGNKIPGVVDFLHQFEEKLHLIRTSARPVANPPKRYNDGRVVILEGSGRWMMSPPMLSMYSLLIRVGFCHKKGNAFTTTIKKLVGGDVEPYQEEDASQLSEAKTGIDRIMKYGYARIFFNDPKKNYPKDIDMYELHESSGIVAFASGESECIRKHWHRKLGPRKKTTATTNTAV
jgi:hypothetical protein